MAEGEWRGRARERWRGVGGGRWWIVYACVRACIVLQCVCVCVNSPALTRGGRWLTSLDFEKSKHCECVWMGAQQDLKDSNEVIEGWVSHTHTHEQTPTHTFTYAHAHSPLRTQVQICDKLKVWEESLQWDNKMQEGVKMSSELVNRWRLILYPLGFYCSPAPHEPQLTLM